MVLSNHNTDHTSFTLSIVKSIKLTDEDIQAISDLCESLKDDDKPSNDQHSEITINQTTVNQADNVIQLYT
ncbi:hypothetical protein MMH89_04395 [Candidatus Comchoanobacter bicostacola]|uniref:Uncharacterized protein n=1 Tax=Candidatus Comchoanobacter bicostacola TaxID=2919598 RepID=A0ABY5DKE2_9GAMM|nr:hypothetical protein [Candidatus Comchoanobacter bicostacola]UTC24458.1 hypothetical protein MMH89_04395 [Candidatus Comchoanobacter bicostacola]